MSFLHFTNITVEQTTDQPHILQSRVWVDVNYC